MNLPNKLTILRVILVPFYVWTILVAGNNLYLHIIATAIFIIASITDFMDGIIARKHNLITNFGKFMDPLADKLLTCSAFICLVSLGQMPAWVAIIIISREFIISGIRLVAVEQGLVIAASMWGKFKTAFQMICIAEMTLNLPFYGWYVLGQVLMWIAFALTLISMIDYIMKNYKVFLGGDI